MLEQEINRTCSCVSFCAPHCHYMTQSFLSAFFPLWGSFKTENTSPCPHGQQLATMAISKSEDTSHNFHLCRFPDTFLTAVRSRPVTVHQDCTRAYTRAELAFARRRRKKARGANVRTRLLWCHEDSKPTGMLGARESYPKHSKTQEVFDFRLFHHQTLNVQYCTRSELAFARRRR